MEILRWALIILSVPVLVIMVLQTRKHAKALSERIEEYKEEQESQQGPSDPYADLARCFGISGEQEPKPGKDPNPETTADSAP